MQQPNIIFLSPRVPVAFRTVLFSKSWRGELWGKESNTEVPRQKAQLRSQATVHKIPLSQQTSVFWAQSRTFWEVSNFYLTEKAPMRKTLDF